MTILIITTAITGIGIAICAYKGGRKGFSTNDRSSKSIRHFFRKMDLFFWICLYLIFLTALILKLRDDSFMRPHTLIVGVLSVLVTGLASYFCYVIGRNTRQTERVLGKYRHEEMHTI